MSKNIVEELLNNHDIQFTYSEVSMSLEYTPRHLPTKQDIERGIEQSLPESAIKSMDTSEIENFTYNLQNILLRDIKQGIEEGKNLIIWATVDNQKYPIYIRSPSGVWNPVFTPNNTDYPMYEEKRFTDDFFEVLPKIAWAKGLESEEKIKFEKLSDTEKFICQSIKQMVIGADLTVEIALFIEYAKKKYE